jgi:hypothetical protein
VIAQLPLAQLQVKWDGQHVNNIASLDQPNHISIKSELNWSTMVWVDTTLNMIDLLLERGCIWTSMYSGTHGIELFTRMEQMLENADLPMFVQLNIYEHAVSRFQLWLRAHLQVWSELNHTQPLRVKVNGRVFHLPLTSPQINHLSVVNIALIDGEGRVLSSNEIWNGQPDDDNVSVLSNSSQVYDPVSPSSQRAQDVHFDFDVADVISPEELRADQERDFTSLLLQNYYDPNRDPDIHNRGVERAQQSFNDALNNGHSLEEAETMGTDAYYQVLLDTAPPPGQTLLPKGLRRLVQPYLANNPPKRSVTDVVPPLPEQFRLRDVDTVDESESLRHPICTEQIMFQEEKLSEWLQQDLDNIVILTPPTRQQRWGAEAYCFSRETIARFVDDSAAVLVKCIGKNQFPKRDNPNIKVLKLPFGVGHLRFIPLKDIDYLLRALHIQIFQLRDTDTTWKYTTSDDRLSNREGSAVSGNHCQDDTEITISRMRGIRVRQT